MKRLRPLLLYVCGLLLGTAMLISCATPCPDCEEIIETVVVEKVITEVVTVPVTEVVTTLMTETVIVPVTVTVPVTVVVTATPDSSQTANCDLQFAMNLNIGQLDTDYQGYFVSQLLLTGQADAIREIENTFAGSLAITNSFSFELRNEQTLDEGVFVVATTFDPVVDLVNQINTFAEANRLFAIAEPNYVVGNPRGTALGGSHGSSGPEGAPAVAPGSNMPTIGLSDLTNQWGHTMIDRQPRDSSYISDVVMQDRPSLIMIDSVPNVLGNQVSYFDESLCAYMVLKAFAPAGIPLLNTPFDAHGLFAGSIASSVAHEQQTNLVQLLQSVEVIDASGDPKTVLAGDTFNLIGQLLALAQSTTPKPSAHSVINLSLGFDFNPRVSDHAAMIAQTQQTILQLSDPQNDEPSVIPQSIVEQVQNEAIELPVISLLFAIEQLERAGFVVVAAAGNHAAAVPQAPAGYDKVIGVEAVVNNQGADIACYSNRGNISAPGGGPIDEGREEGNPCEFNINELCEQNADVCPEQMITGHINGFIPGQEEFAYWAGTSFAAPFVSGAAVHVIEMGRQIALEREINSPLTPYEVRWVLYCTTGNPPSYGMEVSATLPQTQTRGILNMGHIADCVDAAYDSR